MIILGVDPGTLITGFGVIEVNHGKPVMVTCSVVKNTSSQSMPLRLKRIYSTACAIIERYHPDEFAIESAFYGKNAQSALKLGHARGVAILSAVNFEIPTAEYAPREIKKAVTGNGGASKEQVQFMVKAHLHLRESPKFFDASDALATALCHSFRLKILKQQPTALNSKTHSWADYVRQHPEKILQPL